MRGYDATRERLERLSDRPPTDADVLRAMVDEYAAAADYAKEYERDAAAWGRDYAQTKEY